MKHYSDMYLSMEGPEVVTAQQTKYKNLECEVPYLHFGIIGPSISCNFGILLPVLLIRLSCM